MQRPWLMKDAQIDSHDSDINDWNYTYDNDRQIPKTRLMYNFNDNFHNNLSSFVNDICDKIFGVTHSLFFFFISVLSLLAHVRHFGFCSQDLAFPTGFCNDLSFDSYPLSMF